jgi:hypothetical protein
VDTYYVLHICIDAGSILWKAVASEVPQLNRRNKTKKQINTFVQRTIAEIFSDDRWVDLYKVGKSAHME